MKFFIFNLSFCCELHRQLNYRASSARGLCRVGLVVRPWHPYCYPFGLHSYFYHCYFFKSRNRHIHTVAWNSSICSLIDNDNPCFSICRRIHMDLLYGVNILKNPVFQVKIAATDTIRGQHIFLKGFWKREAYQICPLLMHDPILHIRDTDACLLVSWRLRIIYPSCLLKPIDWFPWFVQKLADLLCCLWRQRLIPHVIFVCGFLIIPVRILAKPQFLVVMPLIVADIPEFGCSIAHMANYVRRCIINS